MIGVETMDAVIATYYGVNMFRVRAAARRYAELVHYHEHAGAHAVAGVWAAWGSFAGQWPDGSLERLAVEGVFGHHLDELDADGHEQDLPETW